MSKIYSTNSRNLTDNDYLFNDKKGEKDESYDSPDIKYVEEFSNIIKHNNKITGLCIWPYDRNYKECLISNDVLNINQFNTVDFDIDGFKSHTISEKWIYIMNIIDSYNYPYYIPIENKNDKKDEDKKENNNDLII